MEMAYFNKKTNGSTYYIMNNYLTKSYIVLAAQQNLFILGDISREQGRKNNRKQEE